MLSHQFVLSQNILLHHRQQSLQPQQEKLMTSFPSRAELAGSLADWRTVADLDVPSLHHDLCYECLNFLGRLACLE